MRGSGYVRYRIHVLLGLILLVGSIIPFGSGMVAVAAQTPVDCRGMADYVDAYHQVGVDYMAALDGLDFSKVEAWTADDFQQAQTALDRAITDVSALTPPPAATALQEKATESLQLIEEMLAAMQAGDLLAAMDSIDKVNAANGELDAIAIPLEEHCQIAILDNDNDGTPEIGAGSVVAATPGIDSSSALGTYANPYPIGTAHPTVDDWTIQVDSVIPDGTQQVLAENSFNSAPPPGEQFFIATITATNTGADEQSFDGNFRLRLLGANDEISTAFGNACGVTPNEWDEDIVVAPGESVTGNLCWSVATETLPYLRMFDDAAADASMAVYWSLGQEPAQ